MSTLTNRAWVMVIFAGMVLVVMYVAATQGAH